MGSLLPGWNESAPGVTPKEFRDFKEEEDELGYFAQLKQKRLHRDAAAPLSPSQSAPIAISRRNSMPLGRSSMPLGRDGAPVTPTGSKSFKDPGFGSFKPPPPLQRMTSMPVTAGERFDVLMGPWTPKTPKSPGGQLSPKSPSSSLDAYKTHKDQPDQPNYQWWRHLDSAALNAPPDLPASKDKAYTPQFKVAGQAMHYRGLGEGGLPVIAAQ